MSIAITALRKDFGHGAALNGVDLDIGEGEFVALVGPSGSGKTSLLRIIAGLEVPSDGQLLIGARDALHLTPGERRIGFVFQNYALFRHMRVCDNVAFGLQVKPRRARPSAREIRKRVAELLELVQLAGLGRRFPDQLSGGQRQRVALARALAVNPEILLLDEPFGALDEQVRATLRRWLRGLHDRLGLTSILVTHDQEEALELADRVAVLNAGRIEQIGSPAELYDNPGSAFVMSFLGSVNRLDSVVRGGRVSLSGEPFPVPGSSVVASQVQDGEAMALVRPQDVHIFSPGEPGGQIAIVRGTTTIGARLRLQLEKAGQMIEAEVERDEIDATRLTQGVPVRVEFRRLRVFPRESATAGGGNPVADQPVMAAPHPAPVRMRS